jgi:D-serine deaminase-like pyridoxal phosphate-dependent protein
LTLATVSEAEVFADAGFTDIFIAYPVWPSENRVARLRALAARVSLRIGVDSVESVERLGRALAGSGTRVMVEIDSGHHRSGASPDQAGKIAAAANRTGLAVSGVFTFPGHGYSPAGLAQAARDEADALSIAAFLLERAGVDGALVRSGGSTPTRAATDANVVNELRPGVYVFNDAQQVELGTCDWDDVALTAYATVVSRRGPDVIADAGSKVLGADQPSWVTGGGRLPDFPDARVVALSEHHATIHFPDGEMPELGSTIRIAPNHVCAAVNLADELLVVQDGAVVDSWQVAARGANS